jgi:hypothetical protein
MPRTTATTNPKERAAAAAVRDRVKSIGSLLFRMGDRIAVRSH